VHPTHANGIAGEQYHHLARWEAFHFWMPHLVSVAINPLMPWIPRQDDALSTGLDVLHGFAVVKLHGCN